MPTDEGLEIARGIPGSFQGTTLFLFGAVAAFLALEALGTTLTARRKASVGWATALLVAVGIGLHNFGEGLAIGAAFALGEAALGTLLIIGFTLHNTTEGLAIIAPLARERVPVRDLLFLGLIGGLPTILGTWLGGLVVFARAVGAVPLDRRGRDRTGREPDRAPDGGRRDRVAILRARPCAGRVGRGLRDHVFDRDAGGLNDGISGKP